MKSHDPAGVQAATGADIHVREHAAAGLLPVRYRLIGLTFALSMLLYVDRVAISTARGPITSELGLTDTQFGWVLSAFALGYALFQTPGGFLADRFGARIALASVVSLWSLFTALTGLARGYVALLVYRFLFGAGEAGAYPTCARAFYNWLPVSERGLAQGINFSGARLGAAFALPAIAWLVTAVGWRVAFYLLGAIGLIYAAAWWWWFRDLPEEHPSVSPAERALIVERRKAVVASSTAAPAPRLGPSEIARSANVWIAMGQYFASNFTFFFCLTWLFPYLQRTYDLQATQAGLLSSAPLIGGAIGNWVGGSAVDALYRRGQWTISRRVPAVIGFALAAAGLLGSLAADGMYAKVLLLSIAVFGADMTLPPSWAFCIDIGRNNAGVVSGTMNMAGNVGSFVTSLAFPYLLIWTGSPSPFFVVGATLNVGAAMLWMRARPERAIAGVQT
jgi:ACS family glucarate transporter-like MFS transporter